MEGVERRRPAGWLGRKVTSRVRAMYWMRSMRCESLSSWSMLSLAARCRWKCRRFGEPGSTAKITHTHTHIRTEEEEVSLRC